MRMADVTTDKAAYFRQKREEKLATKERRRLRLIRKTTRFCDVEVLEEIWKH